MLRMTTTPTAPPIELIEAHIAPLRDQLSAHPLYSSISTQEHLRLFMESHVFAVWDFMSLLKALQRTLTCVDLPWVPTPYPASRRFINSIVLGEESDEYEGRPMSHFEIYLEAMGRAGASTEAIRRVLKRLPQGLDLDGIPTAARQFVETTFRVIRKGSLAAQAAVFTFGREDAIPSMFQSLVRDLNRKMGGDLAQFVWYLERHIEVDGEDHGPLSLRMVAELCGDDPVLWKESLQAAEDAIRARLDLWDGILEEIRKADGPFGTDVSTQRKRPAEAGLFFAVDANR
jgi:hypothetical protein